MPKRTPGKPSGPARPIKTKRDYRGVSAVVTRLSVQPRRTSADEQRLQSLLTEMDKFDDADDVNDGVDADLPEGDDYSGPRRRWSDDASGAE